MVGRLSARQKELRSWRRKINLESLPRDKPSFSRVNRESIENALHSVKALVLDMRERDFPEKAIYKPQRRGVEATREGGSMKINSHRGRGEAADLTQMVTQIHRDNQVCSRSQ
jgi:hypothetical protein